MTVLVMFGSKSDEETYSKIVEELKKEAIEYELRIASAHKTPELVEEIIKGDYDLIISGAGLAAHLPGVIAAKKMVPVLGVPCKGAYDGLDAFLSIVQMPPGIPVLCVNEDSTAKEAKKILEKSDKVAVVGEGKAAEKAMKTLEEFGIAFEMGDIAADATNLVFTEVGKEVEEKEELIIYCPVGESKAEDAVKAMNAAKHGLWVGVNRGENAAIAAAEILGKNIEDYRKKIAEKVIKADEEVKK
ncbi:hypothetical protein CMO88_02805 [Candidatus Woesearchaeota archaeon]|nr:hypothetical protein [Candidatus Woesearchaeota archaeon]|tara:strand:+ start:26919 stop:27650 length:732 start_codon:yes stop_codon:yes gene_type:complete